MKAPLRFILLACIITLFVGGGLAAIGASFGPNIAIVSVLLIVAIPNAINPPSHILGVAAAATAPRNTEERPGDFVFLPVKGGAKLWQGTLIARDANGYAVPASDTAGLRVVGRAEETVDNTNGDDGDLSINIRLGVFKFDNSADHAITAAMIGKMAEVEVNTTVASGSTNHVCAGRILGIDSDGVWIDTRHAFYGPKTLPSLTSTDGTMAAAADDAATKAEGEKIGDDVRALHGALFG